MGVASTTFPARFGTALTDFNKAFKVDPNTAMHPVTGASHRVLHARSYLSDSPTLLSSLSSRL